ncbi:hypothetical protein [Aeromicrobium ginsengisoli]|uniref:hypothetical protein n=1 Tax=Aeromicrobium ginsengisoli TaxID=363867 RepID=UPI00165FC3AA|nr:hypothetical protein [Aeromicrobium ginsengisoli]
MTKDDAYARLDSLATWSPWTPFDASHAVAPTEPGVYLFRLPGDHTIVYVGMAGERTGSGRPQGLHGRLNVYRRGKGAVSGFGEAALDRALADEAFISEQLRHLCSDGPKRAKEWAREAITWLNPQIRWTATADKASALALEAEVEALLGPHGLWNRVSMKNRLLLDQAEIAAFEEDTAAEPPGSDEPATEMDFETVFTLHGYTIDLDRLYREMWAFSSVHVTSGERIFDGYSPEVPAMKRLIHELFDVPVQNRIHAVNDAIRSECRDRLTALGWASKHPGRSPRYTLHRVL